MTTVQEPFQLGEFLTYEERAEKGLVWNTEEHAQEQEWLEKFRDGELPCSFAYTGNCSGEGRGEYMLIVASSRTEDGVAGVMYCQEHRDRYEDKDHAPRPVIRRRPVEHTRVGTASFQYCIACGKVVPADQPCS